MIFSKLKFPTDNIKILIFLLCYLFIPCIFLESSIVNPDLAPELPGYTDFVKGRRCFEDGDWEEAVDSFSQAIKKSRKPYFDCTVFSNENNIDSCADDYDRDVYIATDMKNEIRGKNGVGALTAVGAAKTLSKLKNVVIGIDTAKFSRLLKKTKPEIASLPASELHSLQALNNKGWNLPYLGGEVTECNFFSEHGFARIASDSTVNQSILEAKAIKNTQELGLSFTTWEKVEQWALTEQGKFFPVKPRAIPPSVIEAEIFNSSSVGAKIEVILNENGEVVKALHVAKTIFS